MGTLSQQKYGTGVGSIYAREAPHSPSRKSWLPSGNTNSTATTTFRERALAAGTSLRQVCCSKHRLGEHAYVLLVGDSQLQAVFEHTCDPSTKSALKRLQASVGQKRNTAADECLATRTLLLFVVAAGRWARHFPSYHTAEMALKRMVGPVGSPATIWPTAVVTNFAAPHLLHVHPARPFFDADSSSLPRPRCYPQSTCADFRGLLSFDEWMARDVSRFRQRLGKATRVIFFTPNWICDEKLYPSYKKQLRLGQWRSCASWVMAAVHRRRDGHGSSPSIPSSEAAAAALCSKYTFTGAGTLEMATRMRSAASRIGGVSVLDATALTRDKCNATQDARHYPLLVPMQAKRLAGALS